MQSAQMLVAGAQGGVRAELLLDLEAPLLGVGVLQVRIHGAEVEQHSGRQGQAAQDVREIRARRPGWARG